MEPFRELTAVAVPMDSPNVDTDRIFPSRYLRKPRSEGYENFLFRDIRYGADGSEKPDFVLNQPAYRRARILVAAENFACGSSREHAVWALCGYGFRTVIAPSFGDIFFENAFKNGLLTVVVPDALCTALRAQLHAHPGATIGIDLERQLLTTPAGEQVGFEVDAFKRECLLKGVDEIGLTLELAPQIADYEARRTQLVPFLD